MQDTETHHIIGKAFLGESFSAENVELIISNGVIEDILPARGKSSQVILPGFFNAHTHIGDTIAMDTVIDRPLAELVAPPNGLKHRLLREASPETLVSAMKHSMEYMRDSGTLGFTDFREGGTAGVEALVSAVPAGISPLIFGRDGGELLSSAAGFGLSSAHGTDAEAEAVSAARKAGKLIAIHAGEGKDTDIEPAFELEPDIIIHATNFSKKDIRRAADEDIGIVLCPRSNWLLGVTDSAKKPPVTEMLDAGCRLYLGTDNVMFVNPDMAAECSFLMTVYKVSAADAFEMATAGFSLVGESSIIEKGRPANLTVLHDGGLLAWSKNPLATVLSRMGRGAVVQTYSSKTKVFISGRC